jgi:hypothetical protein
MHFPKQIPLLYTGGNGQIILTKKIEDGGTSIFCVRTGPVLMLTVPSPLWKKHDMEMIYGTIG